MEYLDSLRFVVALHAVYPDDSQVAAHHLLAGGDVRMRRQDVNTLDCLCVVYVNCIVTLEFDEIHLLTFDVLAGDGLAGRKQNLGLLSILVTYRNCVVVLVRAGGPERMGQI